VVEFAAWVGREREKKRLADNLAIDGNSFLTL
jgi:hypothetical protein